MSAFTPSPSLYPSTHILHPSPLQPPHPHPHTHPTIFYTLLPFNVKCQFLII